MTGDDLKRLRQTYDMKVADFARLTGYHLSSWYRLEGSGAAEVKLQGINEVLVKLLQRYTVEKSAEWRAELKRLVVMEGWADFMRHLVADFYRPELWGEPAPKG